MPANETSKPANDDHPDTPFGALEGTHWIESLSDGTWVLIRPLCQQDREREKHFIDRLSPESRRFRFMDTFKHASPALLEQLMDVDNVQKVAFVALAHDDGELREVGVSRYSATEQRAQCECAVSVADDWRDRGLERLLMGHLIRQARKNGFRQMVSLDATDDDSMRELMGHLGFQGHHDPQDSTQVIHTLDL